MGFLKALMPILLNSKGLESHTLQTDVLSPVFLYIHDEISGNFYLSLY